MSTDEQGQDGQLRRQGGRGPGYYRVTLTREQHARIVPRWLALGPSFLAYAERDGERWREWATPPPEGETLTLYFCDTLAPRGMLDDDNDPVQSDLFVS